MYSSEKKVDLIRRNISNICNNIESFSLDFTFLTERGFRSILCVALKNFLNNSIDFQNTELVVENLRNEGYVDVQIPINSKKTFFIECKMWKNPSIILEAFYQVINYAMYTKERLDEFAIVIFRNNHLLKQENIKKSEYENQLKAARKNNILKIKKDIEEWFVKVKSEDKIKDFKLAEGSNHNWEFEIFNPNAEKIVKVFLFICHCPIQNYFKCKGCGAMFQIKKPEKKHCQDCIEKEKK